MFKKPLIRCLSLLLIVIAVIGVMAVNAAETTPVAADGLVLEDMPIVLPANATDVEKTAAKELQHYLKAITGKNSSVITESAGLDGAIYLGATKFAKENNVTYTDKNGMGEGWAIKAIGSSLVITGGEARGTLYGVYHLLEDVFGVHWWNMWEEYVPELDSAVVDSDLDLSGEPVFADRGVYSNESLSTLYYVRNRQNGWTSNAPHAYGDEENFSRPYHVHIFNRYYPPFYAEPTSASSARWVDNINPDKISWFEEHPEWFSYSKARGERISYGQLCLSNDELAADLGEKMKIAIKLSYEDADEAGKDRPAYISVTPNDLGGLCECPECEASTAAHGESGHLLRFVNKIAAIIAEEYPEIKVETLAYWQYFEVPLDDTVPADNVVIRLASSDVNVQRDLDHPTNAQVKERLYAWGELLQPGQLWYWDYAVNYSENGVFINHFKFFNDYRHLAEAGGWGTFTECQSINTADFWDLKHWLLSKAQEDPYQNEYELTMIFLKGYYGEDAAPYLFDYLVKMDELNEASTIAYDFSDDFIEAPWLSVEDVKWGNGQFEKAVAATEANDDLSAEEKELFLNRIGVARGGLDRQILANYDRYLQEMADTADGDPEKLFGIGQREVGLRMVKAYQWQSQMELEEDYTGLQNPGKRGDLGGNITSIYSQYVAETDQLTGELLDRPAIPQQVLDDHPGIDEDHIYDFTNSTFWDASYHFGHFWIGDVNEASYPGGTSVMLDHRVYAREKGSVSSYYTFSETKPFKACFSPAWYLGDPIQNDGEWHLYRAEDVIALKPGSDRFTFWDESLRFELTDMDQIVGKPIDVYVSMKVTGDPSGEDPNNYAKVWIDRVILVEDCTCYDIDYTGSIPATCESNEILTGLCPVCGQIAEKEVGGTKLPHQFTGDYVYDAEANIYTNNCSVCGVVVYDDFYAELPAEVIASMEAEGATMDMVHDYRDRDFGTAGITQNVSDSDSPLGAACLYDVNKTNSLGHFKIDNSRGIYTWGSKVPSSQVPKADDIITDGEYHIYKMEGVDLFADGSSMFYLFDWSFQLNLSELEYLKGKTVDMFLSFKVEGELNYDVEGKMPKYYIDRVIIVENCPNHVAESYTWDADRGLYVGTCGSCGLEITSTYPVSLLEDIDSGKTNASHIKDLGAADIQHGAAPAALVDDADAYNGKALYSANEYKGSDLVFKFVSGGEFLRIPNSEMQSNVGKGYKTYKMDDVVVPTVASGDLGYMYTPSWYIQFRNQWGTFNDLMGKTLDIYISMKIEGSAIYLDRFILVDNCGNHVDPSNTEKLTDATCYQGELHKATCEVCGKTSEIELMETRTPHKFGSYTYDPATGNQTAQCQNAGCDKVDVKSSNGAFPESLQADMAAGKTAFDHIKDYSISEITCNQGSWSTKADTDAADGKAYSNASQNINNDFVLYFVNTPSDGSSREFIRIKAAEMKENLNKGYQFYKVDDFKVPTHSTGDLGYIWGSGWAFQWKAPLWGYFNSMMGKTIDMYVSMKVEGTAASAAMSIDRIILVDNCENYEIDYKAPANTSCSDTNVVETGYCSICGKEFTRPGAASGGHSFTKYYAPDTHDTSYFISECDYGCGTIDEKTVETQNWRDLLPEELPASVKAHVIQAYRVPEFYMSGVDDSVRLDPDTGRVVGVREYDPELSSATQYALNTKSGVICAMYKAGMPSVGLGTFKGSEIMANADSGKYHLYSIKGVVPVVYENYNYMYLFTDWVMQCQMIDDDLYLRGYQGKTVDIYLYMKVEGDPSCSGTNKPTYYVDQLIVAESCTPDDTWTVTKEATCTEQGEMTGNCSVCGLQGSTVATPKLPHTIENGYINQQATCKFNAYEYGKCSVCGITVEKQEVPGTKLEHAFSNYVKQEDGVTEIAYCDNGCGERHIRSADKTQVDVTLPENVQQLLPIFGAAGGREFSFSDIKTTDWYFESVKNAWENKLIDGVSATEYRPNDTLTVAQAVKLASAYHERYNTGDVTLTNGAGSWYSSYVDYAVENGIIDSKYSSYTNAQMNKTIDRSEFVAIFEKAMDEEELVGYNTVSDNAIPDVKMDDANADAIYKFYRAGILTGSDGKGTFNPGSSIKRSEVAAILSRMFDSNVRQSITLN